MNVEGFGVNLKMKMGNGNDEVGLTNNKKGNDIIPFHFPLIIIPQSNAHEKLRRYKETTNCVIHVVIW